MQHCNDKAVKDAYLQPKIEKALDRLTWSYNWSYLDLACQYWQPVHIWGCWIEWLMMHFRLCNAPVIFQCIKDKVLQGLTWHVILVLLDNLLTYLWEGFGTFGMCVWVLAIQETEAHACKVIPYDTGIGPLMSSYQQRQDHSNVTIITHWKRPDNQEGLMWTLATMPLEVSCLSTRMWWASLSSNQQKSCTTTSEFLAIKTCLEPQEEFVRINDRQQALKCVRTMACRKVTI